MSAPIAVEWEWRKKEFTKSQLRSMPTQFYYVLSNDGLSVCLAWECVPTYDDTGAKYFPPNSYPCMPHEIKRLNRERARRLGIKPVEKVEKKFVEEARLKLPF